MGKARYRSPLIVRPNEWIKCETADIWEYGNYKCLYLCVRKDGETYIPSVNGNVNIRIENWSFDNNEPMRFPSLSAAQEHVMKYVDHIRDREAEEAKKNQEYLKSFLKAYVANRTNI